MSTFAKTSRKWQESYDTMVVVEKMTEQLNGYKTAIHVYRENLELKKWPTQVWLNLRERGSNKKRFQYYLVSDGNVLYLRAIQSPVEKMELIYHCTGQCTIPYDWKENMYNVGSSISCSSIARSGLVAGGRQTVFFTTVDPWNELRRDEPYDVKGPGVVPYRIHW